MNKIYTLLAALLLGFQGFSQTPVMKFMTSDDKTDITNASHTIYGDGAQFVISELFYTVMTGVDSVLVGAKRVEKTIINGTAEYYCWKVCYIGVDAGTRPVWIAADSLMMYDGDTVKLFSSYLEPNGNKGTAVYDYIFTPKGYETDTTFVEIIFDILTIGIDEQSGVSFEIYPNPATDYIQLTLDNSGLADMKARIIAVSGQVMKEVSFDGGEIIDVSYLNPGMYFIEIRNEKGVLGRERLSIK